MFTTPVLYLIKNSSEQKSKGEVGYKKQLSYEGFHKITAEDSARKKLHKLGLKYSKIILGENRMSEWRNRELFQIKETFRHAGREFAWTVNGTKRIWKQQTFTIPTFDSNSSKNRLTVRNIELL